MERRRRSRRASHPPCSPLSENGASNSVRSCQGSCRVYGRGVGPRTASLASNQRRDHLTSVLIDSAAPYPEASRGRRPARAGGK
jgi:hypothetical protein